MTDYLAGFKKALRVEGKSELTIKSYLSDMGKFIQWFEQSTGEKFEPQAITALDVQSYRSYLLRDKEYKPSTINRKLSALSKFCRWAKGEGLIKEDPTDEVKGVEEVKAAPKALTHKELLRLLRMVHQGRKKRDIAIIEVLCNTGLRVGELAALKLEDIQISERRGWITVRAGKGVKYRRVPLNADARKALSEYLEVRPDVGDDYLFLGQRGNGLTPSAIWRVVKKYGRRAGLDISPHDLRHTYGTRLVREEGVDLVTVATLMGHKSLDTTAIYTKPSEEDMARAAERLAIES
jgi:site-specific recombinase XerD